MGRRSVNYTPPTALAAAVLHRRTGRDIRIAAEESGIAFSVLSKVEHGGGFSAQTARALARWLGWTTDQVLDAAEQPATPQEPT